MFKRRHLESYPEYTKFGEICLVINFEKKSCCIAELVITDTTQSFAVKCTTSFEAYKGRYIRHEGKIAIDQRVCAPATGGSGKRNVNKEVSSLFLQVKNKGTDELYEKI